MIKKISSHGYSFEQENGKIISVTNIGGVKIELNQTVTSNGRIFYKRGTKGVVQKIHLPCTRGLTSDILEVVFKGNKLLSFMKFKDLEF